MNNFLTSNSVNTLPRYFSYQVTISLVETFASKTLSHLQTTMQSWPCPPSTGKNCSLRHISVAGGEADHKKNHSRSSEVRKYWITLAIKKRSNLEAFEAKFRDFATFFRIMDPLSEHIICSFQLRVNCTRPKNSHVTQCNDTSCAKSLPKPIAKVWAGVNF